MVKTCLIGGFESPTGAVGDPLLHATKNAQPAAQRMMRKIEVIRTLMLIHQKGAFARARGGRRPEPVNDSLLASLSILRLRFNRAILTTTLRRTASLITRRRLRKRCADAGGLAGVASSVIPNAAQTHGFWVLIWNRLVNGSFVSDCSRKRCSQPA